jgi:hypothetical protein
MLRKRLGGLTGRNDMSLFRNNDDTEEVVEAFQWIYGEECHRPVIDGWACVERHPDKENKEPCSRRGLDCWERDPDFYPTVADATKGMERGK